jgi:hypothetical protein
MNLSLSSLQDWLHREYAQLLTSGAQLLLLLLGLRLQTLDGWLFSFSAIALISVFAWLSALYRLRALRNTPTSKIASAAQGYVELTGRGQAYCEQPLLSTLSRRPCLWCRYRIEQRDSRGNWEPAGSGQTEDSFIISDDTGKCVVDPERAEIVTQHYRQWQEDTYRYTEWMLMERDVIYVIGQFSTQGGSTLEFDARTEVSHVLSEWKKDMPALRKRFDLNQDGELDMKEWELVQQAARREVDKMMAEMRSQPDMHYVNKPADGKLYLISNLPQHKLTRRYLLWSWAHLTIFFAALGGLGWALQHSALWIG